MSATMKCLVVVLAAVAVIVSGSPHGGHQGSTHSEAVRAVSESNLDFTKALFKEISKKHGNLFFSPTSIHVILAMTSLGARGETAQEMIRGLHLPSDQQKVKDGFRSLMTSLQSTGSVTTKIANRIFTDAQFTTKADFIKAATNDFHSGSEAVDFQHKHEEARAHINSWVLEHTENKITNLLPAGSLDSNTVMVLVNALYFKGAWSTPFEKFLTTDQPFYVSPDVTKTVSMMSSKSNGGYAYTDSEALNAQILEIPYKDHKVSMMIILPKEKHGLQDVEARLSGMSFNELMSREVTYPTVQLYLPKFKLEHPEDLTSILIKMGMPKMFTTADFSGLLEGDRNVQVSKVIHKAFIEVDEAGTEAAAATAVEIAAVSAFVGEPPSVVTFRADHPFLFTLVKTEITEEDYLKHNTILFMGRVEQP